MEKGVEVQEVISKLGDLYVAQPALVSGLVVGGLFVALIWAVRASSYCYH
jgi:hypothetical protein